MKFRIFTLLLAALLLLGGSVFACGDDDDPSTGSGQAEDADDDADDDTTSPDDDDTGDDDTETAFNSAVLAGKTYYCDIPLGAWSKPIGVGDIIGYYVPILLFGVQSIEKSALDIIASIGVEGDAITQDECVATTSFTGGSVNENGSFEIGPEDYRIRVHMIDAVMYRTTLTGTFSSDGSGFENATLAGLLDVRELIALFYYEPDVICQMASTYGIECLACPTDEQAYCVEVMAEDFVGEAAEDLSIDEIGPDDIGDECDNTDDDLDDDVNDDLDDDTLDDDTDDDAAA